MPKAKLFSDADLLVLRRLYYEQAPTVAGLLGSSLDPEEYDPEGVAKDAVILIEALIDAVAGVEL
jgi:hypothetical protein